MERDPEARAPAWRRYLRFWRADGLSDLDDELRFHTEMRARDYRARGLADPDAREAALHRFGDTRQVRAVCADIINRRERRMTRVMTIDALKQDLSYALRTLRRQKGFSLVAMLTLGLGIGATTAVFSVFSSIMLHPLPYPNVSRVALIFLEPTGGGSAATSVMVSPSPAKLTAWRQYSRTFEDIEGYTSTQVVYHPAGAAPLAVTASRVLPSFPRFAGVQRPLLGRELVQSDITGHSDAILLSETFWRSQFGADTAIVGRTITLNEKLYTVAGVMPSAMRLPRVLQGETDVWLPLDLADASLFPNAVGRLRPRVTEAAAAAELDSISTRVAATNPDPTTGHFRARVAPPTQFVNFRQSLLLLTGAVGLVLLIACANVAHLLIARSATRQRELAIRAAIGAGRGRIFRQLVTESVLLAVGGVTTGLVLGWAGLKLLLSYRPDSLSELASARLDATTLLLTIAIGVVSAVVFGVIGAMNPGGRSAVETLRGSRSNSGRGIGRAGLIVSEMALSLVLLVGAGLLVRSVVHLQTLKLGFEADDLYSVSLPAGNSDAEARERAPKLFEALREVRALPGVSGVTLATAPPPGFAFLMGALQVDGFPAPPKGQTSMLRFNAVAPDYFAVMHQPLVEGRTFTDTTSKSPEIIINEGFARKYWPGQTAVGRRLRILQVDGSGEWKTIVGVTSNALTGGLTSDAADPTLFTPTIQVSQYLHPALLVRVADARALPAIRTLAARFDPSQPAPTVTDIGAAMARTASRPRFTMLLLSVFTACAIFLTAVGLYGVMAYSVAQRTREIGIRLALGASPATVGRRVLGEALRLSVAGAIIGLGASLWGTRLIDKMLYGIPRTDPASYAAAIGLLLVVTILSCVAPMRRALTVDPMITMRSE